MARSPRYYSFFAAAALVITSTMGAAFHWVVDTTVLTYHYALEVVTGALHTVVTAFKQDRLERPARVALVQACARALTLAKRDTITVRAGSWRMCPSI